LWQKTHVGALHATTIVAVTVLYCGSGFFGQLGNSRRTIKNFSFFFDKFALFLCCFLAIIVRERAEKDK